MTIPSFALLPYQPDFRHDKAAEEERNDGESRRGDGCPGAVGAEGAWLPPYLPLGHLWKMLLGGVRAFLSMG